MIKFYNAVTIGFALILGAVVVGYPCYRLDQKMRADVRSSYALERIAAAQERAHPLRGEAR